MVGDRDGQTALAFTDDLAERLANRVQMAAGVTERLWE
jgi:hypothetical protein